MSMEAVMFESPAYRQRLSEHTGALDRVKALVTLPDRVYATTQMVADYFEVGVEAVKSLVKDHRGELQSNGYRVLAGQELRSFKDLSGLHPRTPWLGIFSRRTILNVAMLLRDSEVAREVRRYLLDVESRGGGTYFDYDELVAELEARLLAGTVGERLARCEGMLLADRGLVRAMSVKLCEVGEDVRELRVDLAELRRGLGRLGVVERRRPWRR